MKLTNEDKIVLFRFTIGVVYGVLVFVLSLFIDPLTLSPYIWGASVLVYYFTLIYVAYKYRPTSRFQLYIRGLATYYAAWLLVSILLKNMFCPL